jgi:hypothetical protein
LHQESLCCGYFQHGNIKDAGNHCVGSHGSHLFNNQV